MQLLADSPWRFLRYVFYLVLALSHLIWEGVNEGHEGVIVILLEDRTRSADGTWYCSHNLTINYIKEASTTS